MKDLKDYIKESLLDDFDVIADRMDNANNIFDMLYSTQSIGKFREMANFIIDMCEEMDISTAKNYKHSTFLCPCEFDKSGKKFDGIAIGKIFHTSKRLLIAEYTSQLDMISHICTPDEKEQIINRGQTYKLPDFLKKQYESWLKTTTHNTNRLI